MSPLPGTRVVHPRWSGHHRPTTAGSRTATCTITTGGAGDWSPTTGPTAGTATVVHTGTCRVQALNSGANAVDAAGQIVVRRPYLVTIISDAPDIPVGARVRIDTCPNDARLIGKTLTVADPKYGSLRFDRDLLCDLDLTNQT
nr:DUF6093 family protein [uncultured Actinotalea sp.]